MQTTIRTLPTTATSRTGRFRPLAWIVRLDAAWRQYRRFKSLDAERLSDLGLTKTDRDRAFFRQFSDRGLR